MFGVKPRMLGTSGRMGLQRGCLGFVYLVAYLTLVQTQATTEPPTLSATFPTDTTTPEEFSESSTTEDFATTTDSAGTTPADTTFDDPATTANYRSLNTRSLSFNIKFEEEDRNVTVSWTNISPNSSNSYNVTVHCAEETEAETECGCEKCEEIHETTENTFLTFRARPDTNYSIEVVDLDSNYSERVFNRTRPLKVLQLPSVNATENKTSVDLQWAIDCPYTVPGNYSIFFNGTTIEPKINNCSHQVRIPRLSPYTNYTYRLQYFNEKCTSQVCPREPSASSSDGDGSTTNEPSPGSCLCMWDSFMTLPDVPSMPRTLALHGPLFDKPNNKSNEGEIVWKIPEFVNGELHNYRITVDLNGENIIKRTVNASSRKLKVNLRPETSYYICVKARNKKPDKYGLAKCENITTLSGTPFFKSKPWYDTGLKSYQKYAIVVNSSAFDESNGRIIKQEILFAKSKEELTVCDTKTPPFETISPFTFKDLEPGTPYDFAIRISTKGGEAMSKSTFRTEDAPVSSVLVACLTIIALLALAIAALIIYNRLFSPIKASTSMELPLVVTYPPDVATERKVLVGNLLDTVTELHKDGGQQLTLEYSELRSISPAKSTLHASLGINDYKNRYVNILPFDDTRVILNEYRGIPGSDYINASYIHGYTKPKEFIASQGPKEELKDDFWRLVWEKNVHVIVMVTQCVEANKEKCCTYWPSPSNVQGWRLGFPKLHVRTVLEVNHQPGGYITRKFELSKGSRSRVIQHFHYVSWPDMGCPQTPDQLIQFVKVVRAAIPKESSHTLIHCSAGVGRTGTFIALSNLMDEMECEGSVDVFHCVYRMRHHRTNMVQTQSQYSFVYKCILKHYLDSIGESDKYCLEDSESASLTTNVSVVQDNPYFMEEYREDEGLIPLSDDEDEENDEDKKKVRNEDKAEVNGNELHGEETVALIDKTQDVGVKANGVIKHEEKSSDGEWEDINIEANENNEEKGDNKQSNGN